MALYIFDLDGTLLDTRKANCDCISYALTCSGYQKSEKDIMPFLGRPIGEAFRSLLPVSEHKAIREYVRTARERYGKMFISKSAIFLGVADTLGTMRDSGNIQVVATVLPKVYADALLEHFGILGFFESVEANQLGREESGKHDLVGRVMSKHPGAKGCMVGDTIHDIRAGRSHNLFSIGVTYGYGLKSPSERNEADFMIDSFPQILDIRM